MDLLIAEPLEPPVLHWLQARHRVDYAPTLAQDARALRQSLFNVRAALLPASVRVDAQLLAFAPLLRVVARLGVGMENLDLDACARAGVEAVRGTGATAAAEAEFLLGAMLTLRRGLDPQLPRPAQPRELASATVGLVGLAPASRPLAALLSGFGSRLVGYDPSVHATDLLWGRWRVEPLSLRSLLENSDLVCVQLPWYSRYQGLLGERQLAHCKPQQLLVSSAHAGVFDIDALAQALRSGRIAAAWLDSLDRTLLEPERALHGVPNLVTTQRIAGRTVEARERALWTVAQRLDELLNSVPSGPRDRPGSGPVSGPAPFDEPGAAQPLPLAEATETEAEAETDGTAAAVAAVADVIPDAAQPLPAPTTDAPAAPAADPALR